MLKYILQLELKLNCHHTRKILLTMHMFTIENNRDPNSKWPTTDLSNTLHNAMIGSNDTAIGGLI